MREGGRFSQILKKLAFFKMIICSSVCVQNSLSL
jgi:hypothetical protein